MVEENRTCLEEDDDDDDERLRIAVVVAIMALREMLGIFGCGKVERRFCCDCCCCVTLTVVRGLASCME